MEMPKEQILGLLRSRGDKAQAEQADRELPDSVDLERDSGLLSKLGVDPGELLARLVLAKFGLGEITGLSAGRPRRNAVDRCGDEIGQADGRARGSSQVLAAALRDER
jgi:hypothetical protein